jgi:hypothetical protein
MHVHVPIIGARSRNQPPFGATTLLALFVALAPGVLRWVSQVSMHLSCSLVKPGIDQTPRLSLMRLANSQLSPLPKPSSM